MFRFFTTLFLLAAFAAQTFSKAIVVLDYYSNTSFFAKKCENKTLPSMHCNGKCQMMKKLQQQEKKEQENPEKKGENKNEVLSSKTFFALLRLLPINNSLQVSSAFITTLPVDRAYPIFHPPA